MVVEPGQLVGDRLALHGLVQADVLDRDRRRSGEVGTAARGRGRRTARLRADRRASPMTSPASVPDSGWASACSAPTSPPRCRGRSTSASRLGGAQRLQAPVERAGAHDLLQRPSLRRCARSPGRPRRRGRRRRCARRSPAARRGRGWRRTSGRCAAATSAARARSWRRSSRRAPSCARHLVELLAQLGELVAAVRRHLRGEVARGDAPRRGQEGRRSGACSDRDTATAKVIASTRKPSRIAGGEGAAARGRAPGGRRRCRAPTPHVAREAAARGTRTCGSRCRRR